MVSYLTRSLLALALIKIWNLWNIRGAILLGLSSQILMVLVGPFRKSTRNGLLTILMWSAYNLVGTSATFALSHIIASQPGHAEHSDLFSLWAPFILLHLGGPDSVTALSLEDNELWLRHFLELVIRVILICFFIPSSLNTELRRSTTLPVLVAGMIKYSQRTYALYRASLRRFRDNMLSKVPDPGPDYAKVMEVYGLKKECRLPAQLIVAPQRERKPKPNENSSTTAAAGNNTTDTEYQHNLELVNRAYSYSRNILNGLLVDLVKVEDLDEAVDYLKNKKAKDALAVMEVELNFMYEILYTKVVVVNSKLGYIVRVIAFGLVLASLGLFHVRTDKDGYNKFDVGITYALLLVAVVVDVMELLMIKFSDWTCVRRRNRHCLSLGCFNQVVDAIFSRLLALKKCRWIPCQCKIDEDVGSHNRLATPFLFRRWSGSVSTLNLISYCLKRKETSIHHVPSSSKAIPKVICWWWLGSVVNQSLSYVGKMITEPLMPYWGPMMYVSTEPLTEDLWKYIFDEVLQKLEDAGYDPQSADILSERALAGTDAGIRPALKQCLTGVPYDESIFLWHIATDLCYYTTTAGENIENDKYRQFSKIMSDYMLYLLVMQPTMMYPVAGIFKTRLGDTCAEAKRFFRERQISLGSNPNPKTTRENILSLNTDVEPAIIKGPNCKSVLFDASILAKDLMRWLNGMGEEKWKLVSRVWVELLSYAAIRCPPTSHGQQLSKGGELITFVWVLMTHSGLGHQIRIDQGRNFTKLIVGK